MLPAWIQPYIGIPFNDRGRDAATGLDCWGLYLFVMARQFGVNDLPDFTSSYERTRDPAIANVFQEEMTAPRWTCIETPDVSDAIVLRIHGKPRHIGMYVGDGWMLSTDRRTGSCVDRLKDPRWVGKIEGYYRYVR